MPQSQPEISIIIRTKNEGRYLEQVLKTLQSQTYQDFEIIIVDDHSIDATLNIAYQYGCKIVTIPTGKFSHPFSCNLGAKNANGKYLVYLTGHSIPISRSFLSAGLKNFIDKRVAGVYSHPIAHKHSTLTDKIIYNISGYTIGQFRYLAQKNSSGLLGNTSSMIRKDLWQKYNFNEHFNQGWGGEDLDWAWHFMNLGYKIIHEPKFKVRHSHHLKLKDFLWQIKNWKKMSPGPNIPEKQRRNF
jgi:rhamnosyltransferase